MKHLFTFCIVLISFLLVPDTAMACVKMKAKKSCCIESIKETTETSTCCSTKEASSDSCCASDSKGCDNSCNNGTCTCFATCSVTPVSFITTFDYDYNPVVFPGYKKVKFLYTTPSLSEGFSSIWLIPKIS
ncbi:hypothetical protein [Flavobacterium orientale]|uniref:hypothetical protein n=1 Tax=Flavobacterium orientale TaxID=1756020 RepID=UPI00166EF553|nr:hypothetical protein [Flavobacterium orientale]